MKFHYLSKSKSKSAKTILIDSYRGELFKNNVLKDIDYLIVETRIFNNECNNLHFTLTSIFYFFRYLYASFFNKNLTKFQKLIFSYSASVIKAASPKKIVTFYGVNSPVFGSLCNAFNKIEFYGVFPYQVHNRICNNIERSDNVSYFVFGEYDRRQLELAGQHRETIKIVGSFYSGLYEKFKKKHTVNKKYDLCIVSQVIHFWFDDGPGLTEDRKKGKKIFLLLLKYIEKFNKDLQYSLDICIALRPQINELATEKERSFFLKLMPNSNLIFKENIAVEFSTYRAIDQSKIAITHYSTAAFDSLYLDTKVLFCQFYEYPKFPLPKELTYKVESSKYIEFKAALNQFLSMDMGLYKQSIKHDIHYFNKLDLKNLPQDVVRSALF